MEKPILRELRTLDNLVRRSVNKTHSEGCEPLPPIQAWLVGYLYDNRGKDIFQKDVEAEFDIARSTANKIINSLEAKGYVSRESVPYDARLNKLILTEKAVDIYKKAIKNIRYFEKVAFEGISDEEILTVVSVIKKVENNIKKM